jgi:hypothetical protein
MSVALRTRNSGGRSSGTLSRQRVDALIDQMWQFRLTLVVAPAGAGKTTALRHFATRASPVAWCSADLLETAPDGCLAQIARRRFGDRCRARRFVGDDPDGRYRSVAR